jgi:hypothetical protein
MREADGLCGMSRSAQTVGTILLLARHVGTA